MQKILQKLQSWLIVLKFGVLIMRDCHWLLPLRFVHVGAHQQLGSFFRERSLNMANHKISPRESLAPDQFCFRNWQLHEISDDLRVETNDGRETRQQVLDRLLRVNQSYKWALERTYGYPANFLEDQLSCRRPGSNSSFAKKLFESPNGPDLFDIQVWDNYDNFWKDLGRIDVSPHFPFMPCRVGQPEYERFCHKRVFFPNLVKFSTHPINHTALQLGNLWYPVTYAITYIPINLAKNMPGQPVPSHCNIRMIFRGATVGIVAVRNSCDLSESPGLPYVTFEENVTIDGRRGACLYVVGRRIRAGHPG